MRTPHLVFHQPSRAARRRPACGEVGERGGEVGRNAAAAGVDEHPQRAASRRRQHGRFPGGVIAPRQPLLGRAAGRSRDLPVVAVDALRERGLSTASSNHEKDGSDGASCSGQLAVHALVVDEAQERPQLLLLGEQICEQPVRPAVRRAELVDAARKKGKEGTVSPAIRIGIASTEEMIDLWADWCDRYLIRSIEDAPENDWDGWVSMTQRLGDDPAGR